MKSQKHINTIEELQRTVRTLASQCYDIKSIVNMLTSKHLYFVSPTIATDDSQIAATVIRMCNEYAPYARIQYVIRNTTIIPKNRKLWWIYNSTENIRVVKSEQSLQRDFSNKQDYMANTIEATVIYEPHNKEVFTGPEYDRKFNSYIPPFWKRDYMLGKIADVPVESEIPQIYLDFLKHLTNNDAPSIEFVLDWASISLRERNRTFLCVIGDQGIGKGTLGMILRELHGDENSYIGEFGRAMDSRFNSAQSQRTLLFLDEVNQMTAAQKDRLKMQNNDDMEVEQKGVDSENQKNWANVYICSNNLNSLRIDPGDRRFSIINTIEGVKIDDVWPIEKVKSLYEDKALVQKFANYLWHRKYNRVNISTPFKSEFTKKIINATTTDWAKWFIDEYCKEFQGKTIPYVTVSQDIREKHGAKITVTRNSLLQLSKQFSQIFTMTKSNNYVGSAEANKRLNNARVDCVKILPISEQKNYDLITEED